MQLGEVMNRLSFQWQIEKASFGLLRDTRRLKKNTNGINKMMEEKMVEENKIEIRRCLLFFYTLFLIKNKTLNSNKNKNILLTGNKEHTI